MPVLSVSQLNRYVASRLHEDTNLRTVFVRGEISNFKRNLQSGHCYFTVRDAEAAVKAVMFRFKADRLRFAPENGMLVIVQGAVNLYERDGSYQIQVDDLQPDGVGAQALALQQLRERLARLGYFAPERKRSIPPLPKKIGIVTSLNADALQDMLTVLRRRYPIGTVCIYPAQVQGEAAPASIAQALRTAGADGCDVILMGRGGGSSEELAAFQTETAAAAVFRSPVPVISAVGHETNFSVTDDTADLRAATPSVAAECAAPDIASLRQKIDALSRRLNTCISAVLQEQETNCSTLALRLSRNSPAARIALQEHRLSAVSLRMNSAVRQTFARAEARLAECAAKMEAVSPLAVLKRGYAIAYRDTEILDHAGTLRPGEQVVVRLASGSFSAEVRQVFETGEENKA